MKIKNNVILDWYYSWTKASKDKRHRMMQGKHTTPGWVPSVDNLPRSTLATATYTRRENEVSVTTPAMPKDAALLFGAWMAHEVDGMTEDKLAEIIDG